MALIELKLGDSVAALKCLNKIPALVLFYFTLYNLYCNIFFSSTVSSFSQEIRVLESLIRAYENYDEQAFQNCLKNAVWKTFNNEVCLKY